MIRNAIRLLQNSSNTRNILKAQINTSLTSREKWDLVTAVCIERKPTITPALNELERDYKQYLLDVELERSLKSDHELRHEADLKQVELLKSGGQIDDLDKISQQTAQDFVDTCTEELSKFKAADRVKEADKQNNMQSLNRKLDKHLVLVVNENIGNQKYFMLPQGIREDGETLRQTAERVLKESCGPDIKAQIYGNAPCGFYKYKYPKDVQKENGVTGAKVFFYFARYLKGQLPQKGVDYKWLDRQELTKNLPAPYSNSVSQFLLDE